MTLQATDVRIEYTATAGQVVFAYPFAIFAATDLDVYVDALLQAPSLYIVTGVGSPTGGTVLFVTGRTAGQHIVIVSNIPAEQEVDLTLGGAALLTALEEAYDRLTRLHHQALEALARSLHFVVYEGGPPAVLVPPPAPLKVLGWNASGTAWTYFDSSGLHTTEPDPVSGLTWIQGSAAVPTVAGQTVLRASGFLPAGITVLGVVAYIQTAFSLELNLTTIALGIPGQVDRYGEDLSPTAGSQTVLAARPVSEVLDCVNAIDVTLTANAGAFGATGVAILTYVGFTLTPAQSVE